MEDLAAKLAIDPMELYKKNMQFSARPDTYIAQLKKAGEMSEWSKLWHNRGDSGAGPVKRGLGIGMCTWGGAGHASQCRTTLHPDRAVQLALCSQDLRTGTPTIIPQGAAQTPGLRVKDIKLNIGTN